MTDVKREPVDYRYDALNWEFIKAMAQIARYAETKYGSPEQYTKARLTGEKGPLNHIAEHLRAYLAGEEHDYFHTRKHQLAAIAYNASMEFFYEEKFGFSGSPLLEEMEDLPCEIGPPITDEEFEVLFDNGYGSFEVGEAQPLVEEAEELLFTNKAFSTSPNLGDTSLSNLIPQPQEQSQSILDKLPKALRKFVK